MSSGLSEYGAQAWAATLVGLVDVPGSFYLALCSQEPGGASDGAMLAAIEPAGGSYHRVAIATGAGAWAVGGPYAANANTVSFGTPAEDWGPVDHVAVCTAAAAGYVYGWLELDNPQQIAAGQPVTLPPGALALAVADLTPTIAL